MKTDWLIFFKCNQDHPIEKIWLKQPMTSWFMFKKLTLELLGLEFGIAKHWFFNLSYELKFEYGCFIIPNNSYFISLKKTAHSIFPPRSWQRDTPSCVLKEINQSALFYGPLTLFLFQMNVNTFTGDDCGKGFEKQKEQLFKMS